MGYRLPVDREFLPENYALCNQASLVRFPSSSTRLCLKKKQFHMVQISNKLNIRNIRIYICTLRTLFFLPKINTSHAITEYSEYSQ